MSVRLTRVNKEELLSIENIHWQQLKYSHLQGVQISAYDIEKQFAIHTILGNWEYTCAKTKTKPQNRKGRRPVAEQTELVWFIRSPGSITV